MAKLILTSADAGRQFVLNSSPIWDVTGTNDQDDIEIMAGTNANLNLLGGNDIIRFSGNYSDYTTEVNGTTVTFTGNTGNKIEIPASTTANTIIFGDGETRDLLINVSAGAIFLGDDNLSTGGGNNNGTTTVNISGAGTTTATSDEEVFVFASDTYAHTITGFAAGDVLNFPENTVPVTLDNEDPGDGMINLSAISGNNIINVTLTGISTANDEAISGEASFEAVFGSGAISYTA
ncbi:MAG: hypothetical protein MI864_16615 [Pseudomonadales bacterium]|nr:hypothetical protein [Pseudomonadales bacterium]